ncbi:MAG: type II secretion system F family protein [Planctomycetales bacterium]|nr:type II secretion system F family protein [Planctomycetales bacterium]
MLTIVIPVAVFFCFAALVGGVAMMFRGGGDPNAEDRLGMLTGTGPAAKKLSKVEATVITKPLDDMPGAFEEFTSRFLNLKLLLEQADVSLKPSQFCMISGGLALAGLVGVFVSPAPKFFAPFAAVTMGIMPLLATLFLRRRRKKAFAKQLPEALELIARALRAGHSLGSGFSLVASEMDNPIGGEFQKCFEEQNLGIPMEEALESLADRVPNLDLRFFATAVILQRSTGGDLAEILDKIGELIRERFKIWGQVQALTGEGRLSGIVLLALPPLLFVTMLRINKEYIMILFTDEFGKKLLAFGIIMQILGAIVIKKIVNIKV